MAEAMDETASILCGVEDRLAIVSISNPKKRNALNPELLLELEATLDRLAREEVRAVVLRGAGDRVFSSGYDISAIRGGAGEEASRHPLGRAIDAIERFPFPVLGMAFGGAYGAACEVLAACDLRYADATARFAIPAAKLSVVYDAAGISRLATRGSATLVGELLLTARPMAAPRALELGLLNGVHPTEELEPSVIALAREIADLAPRSLAATKKMLAALAECYHFSSTEVAHFTALRNQALGSADFAEGQRAFAEKRKPRFSGR
jgi:enoyl-CoA hydratase/carnithine racemase